MDTETSDNNTIGSILGLFLLEGRREKMSALEQTQGGGTRAAIMAGKRTSDRDKRPTKEKQLPANDLAQPSWTKEVSARLK
jgi:hypothetical protein